VKHLEADIVVIAAGPAGLAASIAAAEGGAKVVVFEKLFRTGGQANFGQGIFAVESRLQRLKQYPLTREEAFRIYMDYTHWHADARLVKVLIDRSADTIDWLEAMGVEFFDTASHGTGNYYTWHLVKGESKGIAGHIGLAAAMIKKMAERAESLGVEIFLQTPAQKILKEGDRIIGVMAAEKSGQEIRVHAPAVVLATGGFGGSFPGFLSGQVGDGIRMAQEVGAAVVQTTAEDKGHSPRMGGAFALQTKGFYSVAFAFAQPGLMVNLLGERFVDEEIGMKAMRTYGSNAIARQKHGTAFNIFDEDMKNHFVEKGFDLGTGLWQVPITRAENFDQELEQVIALKSEGIYVADSIEELSGNMGIKPEALRKTVEEYNNSCHTGRDTILNKNPRYLRPVQKPKFYACRFGAAPSQYPGIWVNHRFEAVTEDHEVVAGLYAAGFDIAPCLYHDDYPNVLPANAMGFSLIGGRIAGENALAYAKSP
jgi:fumarate reductase flavoprotein subunit